MRRLSRIFVSSVAALFVAGEASAAIPTAESATEVAWSRAVQQGTLHAYAEFVLSYPDSAYTAQAYAKLSAVSEEGNVQDSSSVIDDENRGLSGLLPGALRYV